MSPFNAGGQFAFDSTSLTYAEDCLYKYYLTMIQGWRSKTGSVHLEFGGWYATALEHFHKHTATGMDREEALREVVSEALYSTWEYDEEGLNGRPWESNHPTKTRANLIRTIVWYVDHFKDDPLPVVILSDGRPAVEYSFRLDIGNDILYCGHIDRLVEYSGGIYVQDQKTTGSTVTPRYFNQFNPDNQMTGYAFAGKVIYNSPVQGVIIDAAQIAVGFSRFERGFTFRSEAQLDEWLDHTHYHISIARTAFQQDYWPMNRTSCTKYGGCVFQDVCSKSPEVREQFLLADFEKKKQWNPLSSR